MEKSETSALNNRELEKLLSVLTDSTNEGDHSLASIKRKLRKQLQEI